MKENIINRWEWEKEEQTEEQDYKYEQYSDKRRLNMKKKGWLRRFAWSHLTLKLPLLDAMCKVRCYFLMSVVVCIATRNSFPLGVNVVWPFSVELVCFFCVCFGQNHSLKILRFLLLFFIIFVCIFQTSLFYSWNIAGFVGGVILIGAVGSLLLVLSGWLSLSFFMFLFLFAFWMLLFLLLVLFWDASFLLYALYHRNPTFQVLILETNEQNMVRK